MRGNGDLGAGFPAGGFPESGTPQLAALAENISLPFADYLLGGAFDQKAVAESRLLAIFEHRERLAALSLLNQLGFSYAVLKGVGVGCRYYPEPWMRDVSDIDILVHEADLGAVVDALVGQGFHFEGQPRSRWGFISPASFQPFFSPDGRVNFDLHIYGDDYPVYRSLTTEILMADSIRVDDQGVAFAVPRPEHMLILAATHAARDQFGPLTVRNIIDTMLILIASQSSPDDALDWGLITDLATRGGFQRPLRLFLALVATLGGGDFGMPGLYSAPFAGRTKETLFGVSLGAFDRVVRQFRFQDDFQSGGADNAAAVAHPAGVPGHSLATGELVLREILLTSSGKIFLHKNLRRLRGLLHADEGLPKTTNSPEN